MRTATLKKRSKFWSYLWGIEIHHRSGHRDLFCVFWSYLWGIEIAERKSPPFRLIRFDLTYEGLKSDKLFEHLFRSHVLILPMRDWNKVANGKFEVDGYVLILPMRDWNITSNHLLWIFKFVLILPMRDWNQNNVVGYQTCLPRFDLTYEGLKFEVRQPCTHATFVLILPMRDWNNNVDEIAANEIVSFDLTYEGLKYKQLILFLGGDESFDLTYEGLKYVSGIHLLHRNSVWILPMRDWNSPS